MRLAERSWQRPSRDRRRSLWPWLVQMGGDRAGWYSWDALDNHGERSARRIVPEWQNYQIDRRNARTCPRS